MSSIINRCIPESTNKIKPNKNCKSTYIQSVLHVRNSGDKWLENGDVNSGSGKIQTANSIRQTANGKQRTANSEQQTANGTRQRLTRLRSTATISRLTIQTRTLHISQGQHTHINTDTIITWNKGMMTATVRIGWRNYTNVGDYEKPEPTETQRQYFTHDYVIKNKR